MASDRTGRARHPWLGLLNAGLGIGVIGTVGFGLPARDVTVDAVAVVVGGLLVASGAGLFAGARWARIVAVIVCAITAFAGVAALAALAATLSFLAASHDAVSAGGVALFAIVALLITAYLVLVPLAQLLWLARRLKGAAA